MNAKPVVYAALFAVAGVGVVGRADEGMWLFSAPPVARLKAKHGFELTDAWGDHVMKSAVKIGASGSFVSADGLILTNHHVGRGAIQQLSTPEKNYARDGFYARTPADELPVPGMEVSVLQSMEDVSARVAAAVPVGADGKRASEARRKVIAAIEKESLESTGLKSEVVTLYQGGAFHLYRYQRYTEVRLVFAPEAAIAHFGDDADNFEYPRFCLDVCFFRAYENGRPAKVVDFLHWATQPTKEGDLVFVAGHPGNTDRLFTLAQFEFLRDVQNPFTLEGLYRNEVALTNWANRSAENFRRAEKILASVQNNRKRNDGLARALQDPAFNAAKREAEEAFKAELTARRDDAALAAFGKIAAAQRRLAALHVRWKLLDGDAFASQSFMLARDLLRSGDERTKPNGERLPAYSDAKRESFELGLFSPAPIEEDLEILRLTTSLSWLAEKLRFEDSTVQRVLAGKSPAARAAELIRGTQVRDVGVRRRLYEGGAAAVEAARDPLIELARAIDGEARSLTKAVEAEKEIVKQAQAELARARFALHGTDQYPDATGTLRLSYGTIRGIETEEQRVPAFTTFGGLFERAEQHAQRPPFNLPPKWSERRGALDAKTTFNFISDCDIIGGNSGSPVLNRAGEFVGIVFDGNLASLSLDLAYDSKEARAVSVTAEGIMAALGQVYGAAALTDELRHGERRVLPEGFTTTASGLSYRITRRGSGPAPKLGQVVVLHYTGTLDDGTVFDSSRERKTPFAFTFGKKQVIKGYEEGFGLLHVGDQATFIIPPELGYGGRHPGKIPAWSTLHFDVEVLDLKERGLADALAETLDASGLEAARAQFAELKAKGFGSLYASEGQLNGLGYRYLAKGKLAEAVAILQWNVELYPESANVFDSLGEAQLKAGRRDEAIASYRRSLELDPTNANAAKVLADVAKTITP